jgi:hypothetical protein
VWKTVARRGPSLGLALMISLGRVASLHGQDLDTAIVRVTLDSALQLAQHVAVAAFPDLPGYILYSVRPRVLQGMAAARTGRYNGRSGPSPTVAGSWFGST